MIRCFMEKDYEQLKQLMAQVHQLHYKHRPDIYVDEDPLSREYFESLCHDDQAINLVYEEDGTILGCFMAIKQTNLPFPS